MPRYVTITPHRPVDELEHRYRHCRVAVERTHWHIVWLVAQGRHVPEVAGLVGYSPNWVREIIRRYNATGAAGIVDQRQHSQGHPPLVTPALREDLGQALGDPPPDGGLGGDAGARLHAPAAPAPRHESRSGRPGGLQKRGLQAQVDAVRAAHPTARLTVWAEDAHRLGADGSSRRLRPG